MDASRVAHWWTRGLGGAVRQLEMLQEDGADIGPVAYQDVLHILQRLANVARRHRGEGPVPVDVNPSWPYSGS